MEQITFEGIKVAIVVLLAIAGAIATIGKAVDTIKGWRKPKADEEACTKKELAEQRKMLDTDKRRLDAHEAQIGDSRDMSKAMCNALNALLMHAITNNSIDKLRAAKDGLDAYMISAGGS